MEYIPQIKYLQCADCRRLLCVTLYTSGKRGEHWVVLYIDRNRRGEYFDSFGLYPTARFMKYLNDNCMGWIWNETQNQM